VTLFPGGESVAATIRIPADRHLAAHTRVGCQLITNPYRAHLNRDGTIGHQFNNRLEFFAPCYSQSFLPADFKENQLFSGLIIFKKTAKQENSNLFMRSILLNGKMRVENQSKTRV
jgi:hypothetical protein